jgi:N-methylhydantoinase B
VRALYDLIGANVRDPASTLGDLDAQLAACRRGMARVDELADAHGTDTVLQGMETLLHTTALRAEAAFRSWPERTVTAEGFLDDEGFEGTSPVRVHAAVRVDDGTLVVDLSGSSPQIASGMNVPISSAHAGTYFAVRAFLGPEVPQNAGLTSRVRVIAPEGTVFNPIFPAALSARHLAVQRLSDVLIEALCELLPERSVAASHVSFPALVFQAVDPRSGRLTLLADILGGGGGARRDAPGDDGIDPYCSNCAILPAEIAELEYPWRIECSELVEDRAAPVACAGEWACGATIGCWPTSQMACTTSSRPSPSSRPGAVRAGELVAWKATVQRAGSAEPAPVTGRDTSTCTEATCCRWWVRGGGGFGAAPSGMRRRTVPRSRRNHEVTQRPEDGGGTAPGGDTAPAAEARPQAGAGGGRKA